MMQQDEYLDGMEEEDQRALDKADAREMLRQLLLEHAKRRHELSMKFQRAAAEMSGFTQAVPWRKATR